MKNNTNYTMHLVRDSVLEEFPYVISNNVLIPLDERAIKFTQTFKEYSPALLRFCIFKLSNKEKALDLVSDTFFRTWQYLQQGNVIENEKSFLYTTARHLIIDEYRKKRIFLLMF